jgi:dCMP deaminase
MDLAKWDKYYMDIAIAVSLKSPDNIKVGSILVSNKDHRILSTGYNNVPYGVDCSKLDFTDRPFIKKIIIHSEVNSILNKTEFNDDTTIYTTRSPCTNCVLALAGARVKVIIYKDEHKDLQESIKLCELFNMTLIKLELISDDNTIKKEN